MSDTKTLLAFDYGIKRIGVAVGQSLTQTASALEILPCENQNLLWAGVDRLVREWQPDAFVLGKPLHADDTETPLFAAIKHFGNQLHARYNRDVHFIDERLSSNAAANMLDAHSDMGSKRGKQSIAGKKSGKQAIDHFAAKLILESWFSESANNDQNP